jgi:hypothetical protein
MIPSELSKRHCVICMILFHKRTVMVKHVITVKVAVLWGEHRVGGK